MIPLECVTRNIAAGSLCRRLGVEEGLDLNPPTFELFLKNDALHDPMVNEYHARSFGWVSEENLEKMKELTFKVNDVRSEEHTSELQSRPHLVCRLLLEKKKKKKYHNHFQLKIFL